MEYGKRIEIYLADGTANGIVTAELSNWNGKAIKIPRTMVTKCDREDITDPGVYFLFCEEDDGTESVYIGEGENVKQRLATHITFHNQGRDSDKYYWHTAVIFTGRDLNKSKIRFLEDRFVNIAREVGRYSVLTKNTYSNTVMKESERGEMEEFAYWVKILLNVLGYKVLEPLVETGEATAVNVETGGVKTETATEDDAKAENTPEIKETATPDIKETIAPETKETATASGAQSEILHIKRKQFYAEGLATAEGFVVLRGAHVNPNNAEHLRDSEKTMRNKILNSNKVKDGVTTVDILFKSPSTAGLFVIGASSNGRTDWKNKDGVPLKDLEQS